MAFTVRATLDALVTLQEALTITSPISQQIKRAYKTIPKQQAMAAAPCFINIPRMLSVSHIAGARAQRWEIRSQILVDDADQDRATDIVLAYVQKYIDALSAAVTLNGLPVILTDISGGELAPVTFANKFYTAMEISTRFTVPLEAVTVES